MRIFLKIIFFLLAILLVTLFFSIELVDYTPYFKSDYYESTKERLAKKISKTKISKGPIHIGFSKVNITPIGNDLGFSTKDIPMAGYGSREGKPAKGVHDSLYVKAIALKVESAILVLIGADMLIIPPNIVEGANEILSKKTKLERSQLFYSATHTHSSLGSWSANFIGEAFAGESNPEIVKWLSEKFAQAIQIAVEDLQPGQIGHGNFEAPDLVRNRLIGELGQEHTTFNFMIANQLQGKKAILGSFDAHATTLSGDNWKFSADYPGYWYKKLEKAGIDFPIFYAGSVGSHAPETKGEYFEKSEYLGSALANKVLEYSPQIILKDTISLATISLKMDLPEYHVRISDGLRLTPFLAKKLFPPIGEIHLQSARIEDFIWTTTPADFSGEFAIAHQNELYKKGFSSAITSFNGGYIGYVIPSKYYHLDKYESRVMSWFGPYMGPYMDEIIYRMTDYLAELK